MTIQSGATSIRTVALAALLVLVSAVPSTASSAEHVRALSRMMAALGPESADAAATIRFVYQDYLDLLFLGAYGDLETALETGGVTLLPADPRLFNIAPRLAGRHPIGEKDLRNQASYVAARPAAVGALLEIASRVRSGPIEVTSMVRHGEYQEALLATNGNAAASVPMHAMGLAFDIGLLNTPLKTVYELRDVLRRMRDEGDILFIGERYQLVFHVVPHPSRIGHFTDVYTRRLGAPSSTRAVVVSAVTPGSAPRNATLRPMVEAHVVSIVPEDETLRDVWSQTIFVDQPDPDVPSVMADSSGVPRTGMVMARSALALLTAFFTAAFRIVTST